VSSDTRSDVPYTQLQRQEAADWFVIIHAEAEPGGEVLQAWLRWLEQAEGNRLAFEAVAQAWHCTPASTALTMPGADELLQDAYEGEQSVGDWLALQRRAMAERRRRPRVWKWLAAASVVAVTLGMLVMNRYPGLNGPQSDVFTTKNKEQIQITLADGSQVWLGPRSTLQISFTKARRGIQLTAGEAFFTVTKDRSRPFVVRSSGGDITAVGTAFNVRAVTDRVTVSVSEGVVKVAPRSELAAQPTAVQVASGQQLTFTAKEAIKSLAITESATPGERARWREGVLVYRDEPLRDVVLDVARYSDKQLELAGDEIGNLHYSGVVYKAAIDEWTSALPESFPVKIVTEGNREIILAR
jgi:transmembrane sensor